MRRTTPERSAVSAALRRSLIGPALIGAAALASLAACSSSGGGAASTPAASTPAAGTTSSSAAAGSSAGAGTGSYVSQSQALLDKAAASAVTGPSFGVVPGDQMVGWKASDMPTPTPLVKGKSITVDVLELLPTGFDRYAAQEIQAIGHQLGWQVKVIAATSPTQAAALAAMQQAILEKPTAIIAGATPGTWVGPALTEAKAQGIYTIDLHQDSTTGTGYDAYVPVAEGVQKALLAAWSVAHSKGSAKVMVVEAPGFTDVNSPAAEDYLSACSGCTAVMQQFNPAIFTDPIQSQSSLSAALATHSDTNYVIWPTAALPLQGAINGISSSQAKGAELLVDGADPQAIQLLKSGQLPVVVENPDALVALAALDDVNRLAQGKPAIAQNALRFPISYWTPQDSPGTSYASITAAQLKVTDWVTPYEQAWKVSLKAAILSVTS